MDNSSQFKHDLLNAIWDAIYEDRKLSRKLFPIGSAERRAAQAKIRADRKAATLAFKDCERAALTPLQWVAGFESVGAIKIAPFQRTGDDAYEVNLCYGCDTPQNYISDIARSLRAACDAVNTL